MKIALPHHTRNFECSFWQCILCYFNILDREMQFSASSQNSFSGKSIFGHLEFFSLLVKCFARAGAVYSCQRIQKEIF